MRAEATVAWLMILGACGPVTQAPTPDGSTGADTAPPSDGPGADTGAPTDTGVPADTAVPPGDGAAMERREVIVPTQMVRPGEEATKCREVRLGNAAGMLARRIHVSLPVGSHHLIVYRSNATTEQPELTPCRGLSGILTGTAPIFIAQQQESEITFPPGVGLTLATNQMIRLEEHFVNTGTAPLNVTARVTFDLARGEGLQRAEMMFWGTQSINIPARSMGTAQYFHSALPGINVFGLTSHTHEYGVLSTIEVASAASGPGREVHRSTSWSEPPLTLFNPPLRFGDGEGLRLVCRYNNTSTRALHFGESFFEEMCFLWAYYYPSQGFHLCFDGLCRALPF